MNKLYPLVQIAKQVNKDKGMQDLITKIISLNQENQEEEKLG